LAAPATPEAIWRAIEAVRHTRTARPTTESAVPLG